MCIALKIATGENSTNLKNPRHTFVSKHLRSVQAKFHIYPPNFDTLLTKLSKIVDHDKSYSFETDCGWFIRFNAKKEHIWNKMSFSLIHLSDAMTHGHFRGHFCNFLLQNWRNRQFIFFFQNLHLERYIVCRVFLENGAHTNFFPGGHERTPAKVRSNLNIYPYLCKLS